MKNINSTFTDDEIAEMEIVKENVGLNWHDLIFAAIIYYGIDESPARVCEDPKCPRFGQPLTNGECRG